MNRLKNINPAQAIIAVFAVATLAIAFWFGWQYFQAKKELAEAKAYLADLGTLTGTESYGTAHIHADFKMYIEGEEVNLFQEKNFEKNKFTHFHPTSDPEKSNEDVIHVHAKGITLTQFLNALGIVLDSDCLTIENQKYCENNKQTLKVYVNGDAISDYKNYVINDLDKILVSFGNESEAAIRKQLLLVGNNAKLHSTPLNFECGASC